MPEILLDSHSPAASAFSKVFSPNLPDAVIVGSLGDTAHVLSEGSESPVGFAYATALAIFGALCDGHLTADVGLESKTRLFVIQIAPTADGRKSSTTQKTIRFYETYVYPFLEEGKGNRPLIQGGVGSAEGLARVFDKNKNVILFYDELRALLDKATIQSSVLLPVATTLYEGDSWDNNTKDKDLHIRDAHLSLIACCTNPTFADMWTNEALDIGLLNRLFIVGAEPKGRVAWPKPPDSGRLKAIGERIAAQLNRLPMHNLRLSREAGRLWEDWYQNLPHESPHTKRLDTLGRRLMLILTLTLDKDEIDKEVMQIVIEFLQYELQMRFFVEPIRADNRVAQLEERIRRELLKSGGGFSMTRRQLQRKLGCFGGPGLDSFNRALGNLYSNEEIQKYQEGRSTIYNLVNAEDLMF